LAPYIQTCDDARRVFFVEYNWVRKLIICWVQLYLYHCYSSILHNNIMIKFIIILHTKNLLFEFFFLMIVPKIYFKFFLIYEDIKGTYIYIWWHTCKRQLFNISFEGQYYEYNKRKRTTNCLYGHPLLTNLCNVCCKDTCRSKWLT
jgi:hypothetical protein